MATLRDVYVNNSATIELLIKIFNVTDKDTTLYLSYDTFIVCKKKSLPWIIETKLIVLYNECGSKLNKRLLICIQPEFVKLD